MPILIKFTSIENDFGLQAPHSAVACRLPLSSKNNAITSPKLQTYIEKAPICSKTNFWPCGGRRPESDLANNSHQNNALTLPKSQTYIEKAPRES